MNQIFNIEPRCVFDIFRDICAIPHGSGHTEKLSAYCMEMARSHGLWCKQDEAGNVLIRRPASPECSDAPAVVLQAHLDMVCVRTDCSEDEYTRPVSLHRDGDILMAVDSTLGADNGIGVSYILALLTQKSGNFPMLEGLLTVEEETTMAGASAFDVSWLQGRQMINLDSEQEGCLLAGSAGGVALDCSATPEMTYRFFSRGAVVQLRLTGLAGGHSGLDIHKNCGNAIRAFAELLLQADSELDYFLCSLSGGRFSNSIPHEACCQIIVEYKDLARLSALVDHQKADLRQKLKQPKLDLFLSVSPLENPRVSGLTKELTRRWLQFATKIPDGVQRMDSHIPNMVTLSTNLGVLQLDHQACQACFSLRSNVEAEKEELLKQMILTAEHFRFTASVHDDYPCWAYREHSPLRDCACKVYAEHTGRPLKVTTIHAGTECGIFCGQLPNLDCISIGPDIMDAHTVEERTSISSVNRVWQFLQALLAELGQPKKAL